MVRREARLTFWNFIGRRKPATALVLRTVWARGFLKAEQSFESTLL